MAGGQKYICAGIFFKFALDVYLKEGKAWLYGGSKPNDDAAMKAAKNDIIGLNAFVNANVEGL